MQNYKNIWAAIKASGDFDVIEGRLVTKYAANPAVLNKFNLVKANYDNPANALTADDYDNALAKVNVGCPRACVVQPKLKRRRPPCSQPLLGDAVAF